MCCEYSLFFDSFGRNKRVAADGNFHRRRSDFSVHRRNGQGMAKKFLLVGAKFNWYCLEVRHFNCFNQLSSDESYICWDRYKSDVWVRQPPSFAIRNDPALKARSDTYQLFLPRVTKDGIVLSGVRAAESIQRLQSYGSSQYGCSGYYRQKTDISVYDWKTSDVWKYLYDTHTEIPNIYLYHVAVRHDEESAPSIAVLFFRHSRLSCPHERVLSGPHGEGNTERA